jgi:peroxiredoxin
MQRSTYSFLLLLLSLTLWQCASETGLTISGEFVNAGGLNVVLEKAPINQATTPLEKTMLDDNGTFSINFPDGLPAGIYTLRVGAQQANLILDGDEKNVNISGRLSQLQTYEFNVTGSPSTELFTETMLGFSDRRITLESLSSLIDTAANPLVGALTAYRALGRSGSYVNLHQQALRRLDPASETAQSYGQFVASMQQQIAVQQRGSETIQVGQEAPNIVLPTPQGENISLADLRGQIVLLDFWASWCGPCRKENPNVVKVYDKYKNQGFTVYSVSLDGIDSRTAARIPDGRMDEYLANQKKRWVDAIAKDNLKWPHHVSDLKKWESTAAALYGVRGIPKAFLIDREGKIAATNLRGAAMIESALQDVL